MSITKMDTTEPRTIKKDGRHCYVGAPECLALDQACHLLTLAYGETCYIVGSALVSTGFRDVDVRMIMEDKNFEVLFGPNHHGGLNAMWSLTCTALSEYLSKRSGLKVDFQIQRRSDVKQSDWDKPRVPAGLFVTSELPAWNPWAKSKE